MPTPTEETPTEVVLAIFYTQAKRLEERGLIQVLAGTHHNRKITYIRMPDFEVDTLLGFRLVPTQPTPVQPLAEMEAKK